HLVAGAAYAAGLEAARIAYFYEGRSPLDALISGLEAAILKYGDHKPMPGAEKKSLARVLGALVYYFEHYPLEKERWVPINPEGKAGIEFSFAEPFPTDQGVTGHFQHPNKSTPLLFVGRADMLVKDKLGEHQGIYCLDDKTCSQLGASWARQWTHRGQFTGYQWGANQSGFDCRGTIVRGLAFYVNDRYATMEVLTLRTKDQVDLWLRDTAMILRHMLESYHYKEFPHNDDSACSGYSGCDLSDLCKSKRMLHFLRNDYTRKIWSPVDQVDMSFEEYFLEYFK
ncbi:MAG: hypothetical protein GY721_06475, partial [Deltaproteobacteria bacterium]|nr:hypothetical protein [Deltaproteobacteria bacterium]